MSNNMGTKKGYGVIYIMTCIPTGKSYIGQAINYTSGNVKWSGKRRVKSHFRESSNDIQLHCRLLRDAIIMYGENAFIWRNLKEIPERELNYWEDYFVESFNTIKPKGYNITRGGDHLNVSCERLKELSENARQRALKSCPKYIFPIMRDTHVEGYYVEGYPDRSNNSFFPKKEFTDITHNCRNLKTAIKYIKQLDVLNDNFEFDDRTYDIGNILKDTVNKQTGLPAHIYRVKKNGLVIGYEITIQKTKENDGYSKKFNNVHMPLKEKYKLILEHMTKLRNEKIVK